MDILARCESSRIQILENEHLKPILVQNASPNRRPYIHPILAPVSKGCITENEPWHHIWQHGLYTGLHGVNGWDFWTEGLSKGGLKKDGTFHPYTLEHPIINENKAKWNVICEWKERKGLPLLTEDQRWTFTHNESYYFLDLDWRLTARQQICFEQCKYGGLFLRIPYREGVEAHLANSEGKTISDAEGKRARWLAVDIIPPDMKYAAGIAIFDHPENITFPVSWRADKQYGVSPSPCILAKSSLEEGQTRHERYRLYIFDGSINKTKIEQYWNEFAKE